LASQICAGRVSCPKANAGVPKIATFRKWLLAEAAEDARRLRKMFAETPSQK
jgi:LysR family glycine cleavage system transcriptional activator